jgi:hypothetical protein
VVRREFKAGPGEYVIQRVPLVIQKSTRSGSLFQSVGQ